MAAGEEVFDYVVLGGGSGGVSSARRAAGYGAKVALIENSRLGGTCVNVGCVPKKVMFNAAFVKEVAEATSHYRIGDGEGESFPEAHLKWSALKEKRDAYVARLNGIYGRLLDKSGVTVFKGTGSFLASEGEGEGRVHAVKVAESGQVVRGKHVLIATGGRPFVPDIRGKELVDTSDQFFEWEEQPKKVAVVGSGYIGCELAGILHAFGSEVHLYARGGIMGAFDKDLCEKLKAAMVSSGIHVHCDTTLLEVSRADDGTFTAQWSGRAAEGEDGPSEGTESGFDRVLYATGRVPLTDSIGLDTVGVETSRRGHIPVNEWSETNVPGIYAVGDVIGKADLTPVAIACGRLLADRLFHGKSREDAKMSFDNIPTVTFTHPPMATCGLTEAKAREVHGDDAVKVYKSTFVNMFYAMWDAAPEEKPRTFFKLVCVGEDEKVVGLHMIGLAVDEILQGFGVAMNMGANKADFDRCVAIHPTAAEEAVTFAPWRS